MNSVSMSTRAIFLNNSFLSFTEWSFIYSIIFHLLYDLSFTLRPLSFTLISCIYSDLFHLLWSLCFCHRYIQARLLFLSADVTPAESIGERWGREKMREDERRWEKMREDERREYERRWEKRIWEKMREDERREYEKRW